MRIMVSLLFILCLFSVNGFAQKATGDVPDWDDLVAEYEAQQKKKFVAKVKLSVYNEEDKNAQALTYSYLSRELRSIPDIELTDEVVGSWQLILIMLSNGQNKDVNGEIISFCYSYTYVRDGNYLTSGVGVAGINRLQDAAKQLVAKLDANYIEIYRNSYKKNYPELVKNYLLPDEDKLIETLREATLNKNVDSNILIFTQTLFDISPSIFNKVLYSLVDANEDLLRKYLNDKLKKKIKN